MIFRTTTPQAIALVFLPLFIMFPLNAQDAEVIQEPEERVQPVPAHRYQLVEAWTAYHLQAGETKIGLMNVEYGITNSALVGTDFLADLVGAPNMKLKTSVYQDATSTVAFGLRGAYVSKDTIFWGGVKDYFDTLDARIVTPSLSWSYLLSKRLALHTHWGIGLGRVKAKLSEKGKRKLWETKYPNGNYDERETDSGEEPGEDRNQEKNADDSMATFKQRTFMFSSLTGLISDTFQMTGEFNRQNGTKVLATTRVEKTRIENLKANAFRFTVAQQWIWPNFQFRLGVGLQYLVITGVDLDGERVNEAGIAPAADIDFYWRF